MGLGNWDIIIELSPDIDFEGDPQFMWLAETHTRPEYEWATIRFLVPNIAKVDDYELEETVVHELSHVVVAEARIMDIEREEHVVTLLSRAFMRACQN